MRAATSHPWVPVRRRYVVAAAAVALTLIPAPASTRAAAGAASPWLALARQMVAPWGGLQRGDGSFFDYVVNAHPGGAPRDPYGRAFMGLALLQAGMRDGDDHEVDTGLRAIGQAARYPVPHDRIVFENLALETAYNLARRRLKGTRRYEAIRPALEDRLKHVTAVQFGGSRPYYNYYLVDSAGLMELLDSGLMSRVPGSALAGRARTRKLISDLVNRSVPRIARRYATRDGAGTLAVLSDPPWNPPAYDAFSLALLARIVGHLGPAAGAAPRELIRRMARSLWALASPGGSVSYYGRSQDESWTLAMTAYGEQAAAGLPGTSEPDAARFEALAARALERLRADYAGGRFGFWITPALRGGVQAAIPGLDLYADAASYSGLTLVGLNWALQQMQGDGPAPGVLAADTTGSHRLASGPSALVASRTPSLWFAVKQGPGVYVQGVGDYRADVRYDSGLVALQSIAQDGTAADILPRRPHSRRADDHADPQLLRGRLRARFWGTGLRTGAGGSVAVSGGYRSGSRWLRRGVAISYAPAGCGLQMSLPTHRGDRLELAFWMRARPRATDRGRTLTAPGERLTLSSRPSATSMRGGYASGTEARLTRVTMRFSSTGKPLTFTLCPQAPGR